MQTDRQRDKSRDKQTDIGESYSRTPAPKCGCVYHDNYATAMYELKKIRGAQCTRLDVAILSRAKSCRRGLVLSSRDAAGTKGYKLIPEKKTVLKVGCKIVQCEAT